MALENYVLQFKPDNVLQSYVIYPENRKLEANESFVYRFDAKEKVVYADKIAKGISNGVFTEISSPELKVGDSVIADFLYEGDAKPKQAEKSSSSSSRRRGPPPM